VSEYRLWSPTAAKSRLAEGADIQIFALHASMDLGKAIAGALERELSAHEEREFEDGEHKARPLVSVRGSDVYVIQSLHGDSSATANDKLCRLLFFIGALKDGGAARVTAITPYLCYARKDRRTKPYDPVTTRYVAALFESVGTDAIVTLDVHNPAAFENAYRCRTNTSTAAPLFIDYAKTAFGHENLCVLSPDPGGVKRAELFREGLEVALGRSIAKGFVDKRRSAGIVSGDLFVGEVAGATALIIDDLISTGNTLLRAARVARKAGAEKIFAFATHGLFMPGAQDVVGDTAIERFIIADSVPPFRLDMGAVPGKVEVLSTASLFAETIVRLHNGEGMTDLLVW
jgi:ribose-phosphate pyrophosphokinase